MNEFKMGDIVSYNFKSYVLYKSLEDSIKVLDLEDLEFKELSGLFHDVESNIFCNIEDIPTYTLNEFYRKIPFKEGEVDIYDYDVYKIVSRIIDLNRILNDKSFNKERKSRYALKLYKIDNPKYVDKKDLEEWINEQGVVGKSHKSVIDRLDTLETKIDKINKCIKDLNKIVNEMNEDVSWMVNQTSLPW